MTAILDTACVTSWDRPLDAGQVHADESGWGRGRQRQERAGLHAPDGQERPERTPERLAEPRRDLRRSHDPAPDHCEQVKMTAVTKGDAGMR
jgi:hypothetical protein